MQGIMTTTMPAASAIKAPVAATGRMHAELSNGYDHLVDIKTVKLRDGASRIENALYFLEQIKNPHKFRVGSDIVEICFAGDESLSNVLVKHFNRKVSAI